MSTRLHNGFRLNVRDLGELTDVARGLRDAIRPIAYREVGVTILREAVKVADHRAMGSESPPLVNLRQLHSSNDIQAFLRAARQARATVHDMATVANEAGLDTAGTLGSAPVMLDACCDVMTSIHDMFPSASAGKPFEEAIMWSFTEARHSERTGERSSGFDGDVDLVAFMDHDGLFYATLHAENPALREACLGDDRLIAFPFWDSTDRPGDVTETEWRKRGEIWSRLLGKESVPALSGFTFTLSRTSDCIGLAPIAHLATNLPDMMDAIDSRSTRARRYARNQWAGQRMAEMRREDLAAGLTARQSDQRMMQHASQAMLEARDAELGELHDRIFSKLPSRDDIYGMADEALARWRPGHDDAPTGRPS
ncbi:hypothetical protein AD929_12975 [Gluconobacter potus]|uniref:Uncharacterized protein n=1 Tax=Gluconobacter potus TaxID=2724927 RepID=A0A149QS11_9PROT|nr:hypothetical protein [Gluconobacter potus]KXV00118.1 hypothetical protein AD929_12975 [Gluconobacter potus]